MFVPILLLITLVKPIVAAEPCVSVIAIES
jgi:hypothetical protein